MATLPGSTPFSVSLKPTQYKVLPPSGNLGPSVDGVRGTPLLSVGDGLAPYLDLHIRGTGAPEWTSDDVTRVVDRYLKAAEYGANASTHHVTSVCTCCMDRNKENIRQRVKYHQAEIPGTRPISTDELYEEITVPEIGIYRSESPDLTIPNENLREKANASQPMMTSEVPPITYVVDPEALRSDRLAEIVCLSPSSDSEPKRVENILTASSKFTNAMKRLNKTINQLQ